MSELQQTQGYGVTARLLHWGMAILIVALFLVAWNMEDLPKDTDERRDMFALHRALGVLAGALILLRLLWVSVSVDYLLPAQEPKWQAIAAKLGHWGLYALLLSMPLTGILGSLYGGHAIDVFGLFTIPRQPDSDFIAGYVDLAHYLGQYALMALVGVHVLAALLHQFVQKDGTLTRMIKG